MPFQLTAKHKPALEKIKSFKVRDSDVYILGVPKSGTTWSQEMVWLLVNDLNYEGAKAFIHERVPVFDAAFYTSEEMRHNVILDCHADILSFAKMMNSPRCIKTHLAPKYLPEEILNAKKSLRNPKDVCISTYYYFKHLMHVIDCPFEEFAEMFLSSDLTPSEDYWNHVLYFWDRRHESNILFIKYEDMKKNLLGVVKDVSKFLGRTLTTEQEDILIKWLDFNSMKDNIAVNLYQMYGRDGFIRNGQIGEHKKKMSPEILSKFDNWIKENTKNTDYQP